MKEQILSQGDRNLLGLAFLTLENQRINFVKCFMMLIMIVFSLLSVSTTAKAEKLSTYQKAELIDVKGKVIDENGQAIAGVTIRIKGSERAIASNEKGKFFFEKIDATASLIFSTVGYETKEVAINGKNTLQVSLKPEESVISDVVITAFGSAVKRQDMIGSVTSINPTELKVPSSNLTTALAGRVAGMIAYQRSGEPGLDNADFFIRGVTTFGYKKDPLILIDNMEMTATDLARLQVDDIASFSIMKDATATAVYGARGANGVILITTKQGVEGKASIGVRYENSLSSPTRSVELADPITYMNLHNEATTTRLSMAQIPHSPEKIYNTIAQTDPIAIQLPIGAKC